MGKGDEQGMTVENWMPTTMTPIDLRRWLGLDWTAWCLSGPIERCRRCAWPHALQRWNDRGHTEIKCANCGQPHQSS